MSVVGFDIGNENCVIAVVRQRGIDVLLNYESKRETPAVVCFSEKQRILGSAGAASAMMHIKSTISQIKRLIGRKFADPDVKKELKMLPGKTSEGQDGGILIHLKYSGEIHVFTPVQFLSMLFAHLKTMTENDLEMPISDCVIGIPSYFTDLQRRAYLDAAKIAGLQPLRLIHDCTATALSYGMYKTDFGSAGPAYVAFIDIGHCDTQVCIASFEFGKMEILSHAFDRSLGGRDFDEVIFSHFAAKFKEEYHIDVYSKTKACFRLRAASEKISSVELVGSGSRIPAISTSLTSLFKREPSRQLNASECVARGCALQCAMLSPVYRVREYEVKDVIPFSIGLSSDEGPVAVRSNGVLFPRGQPFPSVKVITFQRSNLFHLEAFYANPDELPPRTSPKISCVTIGPFHGSHGSKIRVKVRVPLDLHGIVSIESATLIKDDMDDLVMAGDYHSNSDAMDIDPISETVTNGFEDDTNKKLEFPCSSADGTRKDNRRLNVPVNENVYGGMTKAEISEALEKELQLAQQDRIVEQTKEKKNSLESFVYDMRSKLFHTYRSFASEQEKDGISRSLQETEEWLYEDGVDETEHAYSSKLEDLKKLVDPIENRYKDDKERVHATRDLSKCILKHRASADSLPPQDKELVQKIYASICFCDYDAALKISFHVMSLLFQIINECNKVEQWLKEKIQQQESFPKNTDPILWSSDIKSKTEELNLKCQQILGSNASPSPEDKDKPDTFNDP
ncbi:hypothetical protein JHK85_023645 [Glycine max]|nr:hypothetical protein JHK85_023645 [Glycine max]KAG5027256.1 hypothetical protein JHK86_023170 [Glycine max]